MRLRLERLKDDGDTTISAFYIDGVFECFMIEDQYNRFKEYAETRIPAGVFSVDLRKSGGFHNRYSSKFDFHEGMLCIYNKPDWKIEVGDTVFQYVLIHIGNDDEDTAGCLLPNFSVNSRTMRGAESTNAYKRIYPKIANHIKKYGAIEIEIIDHDLELLD